MDFFASSQGYRVQKTLKHAVSFRGVGVHSGVRSELRLVPAPPNHGVVFGRTDLPEAPQILAHYDSVVGTEFATTLGSKHYPEARVSTVEHVLAALFALGVTN